MKIKSSNRNWILIFTFFAFFVVFAIIGYELFDIQYNDEDIVLTHNPTIRKIKVFFQFKSLKNYYKFLS